MSYTKNIRAHTSGKCPVCYGDNIGFFEDKVGALRTCFDCGSEWNEQMEITIDSREE